MGGSRENKRCSFHANLEVRPRHMLQTLGGPQGNGFMFRRCERNTTGSWKEECPVHNGSAPPQIISLEKGTELCTPPLFLELRQVFCTALLQKIRLKASNDLKNGANTSNTRFQRTRVQDLIVVFFDTDCKAFQSSSKKPESVIYSDAFPLPSQHTHHAFQDSLAFKGKLWMPPGISSFKDEQRCIEWSSGTHFFDCLAGHTAICNQAVLWKEGTVCFETKYHANGWRIALSLTLIWYWLWPGTIMTWPSKPKQKWSEPTKLYWKYSPGTSLQIV